MPMSTIKDIVDKRYKQNRALSDRLCEVFEIFKQQFGEEFIDLQDTEKLPSYSYPTITATTFRDILRDENKCFPYKDIIIRVPHETVTNEMGLSTTIYNLFIRLRLTRDGIMCWGIDYKRSSFTEEQLFSQYIHSHCTRLNWQNISEWHGVCTGSGPINSTMSQLRNGMSPIQLWYGFIAELRQIVRVESLEGGPYIRMESIMGPYKPIEQLPRMNGADIFRQRSATALKQLLKSYLYSNRLKLGYINNKFCLGCTFVEWLIDFTEYAKAWAERNGKTLRLDDVLIKDNKVFGPGQNFSNSTVRSVEQAIGSVVINFKGVEYKLEKVAQDESRQARKLIRPEIGATIINSMLNTLNYWYGKIPDNSRNINYL